MRLAGSASLLRAINERAVLGHLLEEGSLTRAELVRLTGLSAPTAGQALSRLEGAGLVIQVGATSGGPGRNATIYAVDPDVVLAAAVDVRPRTLTAAVCDITGTVRAEVRRQVPARAGESQPATQAVADALDAACAAAEVARKDLGVIQFAVPGSYDPATDTIHYVIHVRGWSRPGFVGELRELLGPAGVAVDNDVNLAAAAERTRGAGRDTEGFALLWVSAGLGLAIDLGDGQLRGARGGAGEIGYMPVRLPDGSGGTAEHEFQNVAGGPAIRALAREHGWKARSPETAVARAVAAGAAGRPFLDQLARRLALGVASVAAVLDPPLVVLAGEVCQAGGEALRERVARALPRVSRFDIPVAVTGVAHNPVLLGAMDAAVSRLRQDLIGPPEAAGSNHGGART